MSCGLLADDIKFRVKQYAKCIAKATTNYRRWLEEYAQPENGLAPRLQQTDTCPSWGDVHKLSRFKSSALPSFPLPSVACWTSWLWFFLCGWLGADAWDARAAAVCVPHRFRAFRARMAGTAPKHMQLRLDTFSITSSVRHFGWNASGSTFTSARFMFNALTSVHWLAAEGVEEALHTCLDFKAFWHKRQDVEFSLSRPLQEELETLEACVVLESTPGSGPSHLPTECIPPSPACVQIPAACCFSRLWKTPCGTDLTAAWRRLTFISKQPTWKERKGGWSPACWTTVWASALG